ncbi:MAG: tetratricopeptide repeat protein [Candidatus Omnitrophica bacterium]|nr:tetratricopeptide repeat protein [Candidatus Omnitrophota bacterium]
MNRIFRLGITAIIISASALLPAEAQSLPEEKFQIAVKAYEDGFYGAALSLFTRFADEFPQSARLPKAELYRAKCFYFQEDYAKAAAILNDLAERKNAQSIEDEVYYWLAEISLKGKNYAAALNRAEEIMQKFPDSSYRWWAAYVAARAYTFQNQFPEALSLYEKIIEQSPDQELRHRSFSRFLNVLFRQKRYAQIITRVQQYLSRTKNASDVPLDVYFFLAESLFEEKNFTAALNAYTQGIAAGADDRLRDRLLQGKMYTLLAQGKKEEAKLAANKIQDPASRRYHTGVYYLKLELFTEALRSFSYFIEEHPESENVPQAYLHKADILYEMGRVNDSLSVYQFILENIDADRYPEIIDKAHYGLAWCYLKNGEYKKAIDEFRDTLKYTGNQIVKVSSQIQIADANQERKEYEQALTMYEQILKDNPNTIYGDYIQFQIGMIFLKTDRIRDAFLAFRTLKKNFPASDLAGQAQYYLAAGYFSQEEYLQARRILEDLRKKNDDSEFQTKVAYLYGKCFFNEGLYERAIGVFEECLEKCRYPRLGELMYIDLGNAYLHLGKKKQAEETWGQLITRYPRSQYVPTVMLSIGGLQEQQGRYASAENNYKKVIDSFPDSAYAREAMLSLGHLYWQQKSMKKAEKMFLAVEQDKSPLALKGKLFRAKLYRHQDRHAQALKLLEELIPGKEKIASAALMEYANILKEQRRYTEAAHYFRQALDRGIDSAQVRFSLAMCLEKSGRPGKAVEEYFYLIYHFPESEYRLRAHFRIARLYEEMKKFEAAKEIYRKIIGFQVDESKIAQSRLDALQTNAP